MNDAPAEVDATSKRNGLPVIERLRALREQFGFSLAEAKAVTDATDDKPPLFPAFHDGVELTSVLKSELGYCGCASSAAAAVLRELLRLTAKRTDATGDADLFAATEQEIEELLDSGGGWAEWFVYSLDQKDFLQHGFRQTDLLITDRGRLLLHALERFEPQ